MARRQTQDRLGVSAGQCLFVGDDPRWDIAGPQQISMASVLIDRTGSGESADLDPIHTVAELPERLT